MIDSLGPRLCDLMDTPLYTDHDWTLLTICKRINLQIFNALNVALIYQILQIIREKYLHNLELKKKKKA